MMTLLEGTQFTDMLAKLTDKVPSSLPAAHYPGCFLPCREFVISIGCIFGASQGNNIFSLVLRLPENQQLC